MRHTPEKITCLEPHQVFVFGSNLNGKHDGGAALFAYKKLGATYGVSIGLTGQSYAFPTLGFNMEKLKLTEWDYHIQLLIRTAKANTTKEFLVTKLGCGIASYNEDYLAEFFEEYKFPENVILPEGWSNDK